MHTSYLRLAPSSSNKARRFTFRVSDVRLFPCLALHYIGNSACSLGTKTSFRPPSKDRRIILILFSDSHLAYATSPQPPSISQHRQMPGPRAHSAAAEGVYATAVRDCCYCMRHPIFTLHSRSIRWHSIDELELNAVTAKPRYRLHAPSFTQAGVCPGRNQPQLLPPLSPPPPPPPPPKPDVHLS